MNAQLVDVPQARKEEPAEAADEKRGGKGSATAATAIGGRCGKHFRQQHQPHIDHQQLLLSGKERVVQNLPPVGFTRAVEQQVDAVVAFAKERREEEDEQRQHRAADDELHHRLVLETGEDALAEAHRPDEIEADEAAEDAQQHTGGDALHGPRVVEVEGEEGRIAAEDVGETGGGDTAHQDGHQRGHRQVDHQHLEREHQSGDGGLENARDGTSGTAAHQEHQRATVLAEQLAQVRADGRAGEHDGRLGTHRAAKADGDGRCHHARPRVVGLQTRAVLRDGIEDAGDAVRDVVLHHIAHKKHGEQDAHHRIYQIEQVERGGVEAPGKSCHDDVDEPVEHVGGHGREQTHYESQEEHKHAVAHVD